MTGIRPLFIAIAVGAVFFLADTSRSYGEQARIMGWLEKVTILPETLTLKAKLDTGANTSAIDAQRITRFERDGVPWVRFTVSDRAGRTATIERPIVRIVRIRRSDSPTLSRPVVMLAVCLDGAFREEAVTLTNRSHLSTPMLIGRSMLSGRFLVDALRKYAAKQDCPSR